MSEIKKATIADIAKGAGVSKTTVSRYINGKYEYMSSETRKRIETIIDVAQFRPNNIARSLKSNKSKLIGVVVADIESPFSSAIIKAIGDSLRSAGYNMLVANSDNSVEIERESINSLISQRVEGLIVNTASTYNPFLINIANQGLPLVLCDRFVKDYNFDIAYIDCGPSIHKAVEHLFSNGFKSVAFFTQPYENVSPRYMRREAFLTELEARNIPDPHRFVNTIDIKDSLSILQLIRNLIESSRQEGGSPPAIIASSGVVLLHMLNAILRLKLETPTDIGICGFDDWGWPQQMSWAPIIGSGITTLEANAYDAGVKAVELLMRRISDKTASKKTIEIPANLVPRQSTLLLKS